MTWTKKVPSVPSSIRNLNDTALRRRARDAWKAGHTLLEAIGAWKLWLRIAEQEHAASGQFDWERGDAISRAGEAAITTLCELNVKSYGFVKASDSGESADLLAYWPEPPSNLTDPGWYFDQDKSIQETVNLQLAHSHILKGEVEKLLDRLAEYPETVLRNETASDRQVTWDAAMEARNEWIYKQCMRRVVYKKIIFDLKNKPNVWERIESVSGIKAAAVAYADVHGLPHPPKRQRGRRPRRETK